MKACARVITLLLTIILTTTACVQTLEIDIPQTGASQPVLSGVLEVNDSLLDVLRIVASTSTSSARGPIPAVFSVAFFQDGDRVGEGTVDSAGYITVPPHYPHPGSSYEIIVRLLDGGTLQCQGIAPVETDISNIDWIRDGTQNRHGDQLSTFRITISDAIEVANYYEMVFPGISNSFANDSLYLAGFRYVLANPNPVMANEGDQDFVPHSLFFSDELFDGETFVFSQTFDLSDTGGSFGTQGHYGITEPGSYLLFRSTDRAYYDYLKSWTRHRYTQNLVEGYLVNGITFERLQDLMFAPQAAPLISNVTGGLGVVGAVYTQVVQIQ